MKTLPELKNAPSVKRFDSVLAEDWQTVLLKSLDTLNRLEKDGYVFTRHISRPVAKCIVDGALNNSIINTAINDIREIQEEKDHGQFVFNKLSEVLESFFAVKTANREGGK